MLVLLLIFIGILTVLGVFDKDSNRVAVGYYIVVYCHLVSVFTLKFVFSQEGVLKMSYKIALRFATRTFFAMVCVLIIEISIDRCQPKFSRPVTTKMPANIAKAELEQLPDTLESR